jgi:hypothetical protein
MADTASLFDTIQLTSLDIISNLDNKRISLLEIFLELNLFESIFEPFMTGKLILTDTLDLYKNFPLVGNELIEMTFLELSTNINRVMKFRVYKIGKEATVMRGTSGYRNLEVYLCSEEMMKNSIKRISRNFIGSPRTTIEWLLRFPLRSVKLLDAVSPITFPEYTANFNKPSTIIDFLARNSQSVFGHDYVFYEAMNGFHYKPISYLMQQLVVENMQWLPERDVQTAFRIDTMKMVKQEAFFDHILNMEFGLFGKTLYKLGDNYRYNFVETERALDESMATGTSLGRNMLFDDELFDPRNMVAADYHDHEVKQARTAMMSTILNNNKIVVRSTGTLDRVAGDTLNVTMPNLDNLVGTNESWDGKWLIMGIKHIISPAPEYEQNILLVKNARKFEVRLPPVIGRVSL